MTVIDFQPSSTTPFSFQATLDGTSYTLVVTWNLFGQRYYVSCYTLAGTLVFCVAMVGSPVEGDISLTKGYFTTMLIWRPLNNQFEVV